MKTPIEVLKQRESEIFSCMEGIDGEEWDYCTKTLAEVREAVRQLEKDQLNILNLKTLIRNKIKRNTEKRHDDPSTHFENENVTLDWILTWL